MFRIKLFFTLGALLIVSGCAFNNYYVLSTASQPKESYSYKSQVIGVEKVTVPKYLFKREIAVAKSSNQIVFLGGAAWAEDMDAGLTRRVIAFLQKKFKQPRVYAYPWGMDREPDIKVKVHISRFIAQNNHVYLDANWEVKSMRTEKSSVKLFSTTVPTQSDADSIVDAMDRAFGELEEDVALGVSVH